MNASKNGFSHAAVIFPVQDVSQNIQYFVDILGFKCTFQWEDPPSYAVVKRGEGVSVHLTQADKDYKVDRAHIRLMVFAEDVNQIYEEYQKSGAKIHHPIGDRDYGMRDFDLETPDGHLISIGTEISRL